MTGSGARRHDDVLVPDVVNRGVARVVRNLRSNAIRHT
jgi:hypothetical protein